MVIASCNPSPAQNAPFGERAYQRKIRAEQSRGGQNRANYEQSKAEESGEARRRKSISNLTIMLIFHHEFVVPAGYPLA